MLRFNFVVTIFENILSEVIHTIVIATLGLKICNIILISFNV